MTGEMLGHFRVLEKLGAGGMGEVFKAEDSKLHRFVALKFLPAEMANSRPARERFEREARAIAALNHPNICTLYDYGEQAGKPFLVLELLEGATLRERVQRQLPSLQQLTEWAIQMADALNFAHQRGIVHRDLKPANIFITRHNQAKILDFGLARLETPPSQEEILAAETQSLPAQLTSPGATLGTVAYMSPEQARGEEVDARTDIFSLGVVLYEAATGQACFQAKSMAETLGQILYFTPARPSEVRTGLPGEFDRIILRALQKDPDLRYQHASEVRAELKLLQREQLTAASGTAAADVPITSGPTTPALTAANPGVTSASLPSLTALSSHPGQLPPATSSPSALASSDSQIVSALLSRHKQGVLGIALAGVLVAAGLGAWYWRSAQTHRQLQAVLHGWRTAQVEQLTSSGLVAAPVAISPDGNYVAYVHRGAKGQSLWLRQVNAAVGQQIIPPPAHPQVGFEYAGLTFTPDGGFLDYVAGNSVHPALYQIPVLGGQPVRLLGDVESPVSFSPDGRRIAFVRCNAAAHYSSALMLADNNGAHAHALVTSQILGATGGQFYCSAISHFIGFGPVWSPRGGSIAVAGINLNILQVLLAIIQVRSGQSRVISLGSNVLAGLQWTRHGGLLTLNSHSLNSSVDHLQWLSLPSGRAYQLSTGITSYATLSLDHAGAMLATQSQQNFSSLWLQTPGRPARQILPPAPIFFGFMNLHWSAGGLLIYPAMTANQRSAIESLDPRQSPPTPHTILTSRSVMSIAVGPADQLAYVRLSGATGTRLIASNLRQPHSRVLAGIRTMFPLFTAHGGQIIFLGVSNQGQRLEEIPFQGGTPHVIAPYFAGAYFWPALSPGGRRILLETHNGKGRMTAVVFPLAHPQAGQYLTAHRQMEWAPDNKGISFVRAKAGADNIWIEAWGPGGVSGPPRQFTHFQHQHIRSYAWAKDGRLAMARSHRYGSVVLFHAQSQK